MKNQNKKKAPLNAGPIIKSPEYLVLTSITGGSYYR